MQNPLFPAESFNEVREEMLNNPYFHGRQGRAWICNICHPINFLHELSHCTRSSSVVPCSRKTEKDCCPHCIELNRKKDVACTLQGGLTETEMT